VSRGPQWAICPLDTMTHLLAPLGDEGFWYRAYCGHLLPSFVTRFKRPPQRLPCPDCAVMSRIVAPFPTTSVAGAGEVKGDGDVPALGRASRAVPGRQASAGPAPEDAAWAGPPDAADLLTVPAQHVFSGQ
jgi:hypothetical protein